MDIWSKEKRSFVMSKIRSKNTKPELLLRKALFSKGLRYRIHDKKLPGKPDLILKKYKTVIFVHGCFWHYHKDCKEGRIPDSNSKFWEDKLLKNIARDELRQSELRKLGWKVIIVWECEIENKLTVEILESLIQLIKNDVI